MKQIKQMRRDDWFELFISEPTSIEQARIAIKRAENGHVLASYEVAAIEAYKLLQQRIAA